MRWERGAWFVWWVGGGRDGGGGGAVRKVQVVETPRRTPEEAIATNS